MSSKATIYTDGACAGNQNSDNVGGWGAVIDIDGEVRQIYGGERNTTNNRMELKACIKALEEVLPERPKAKIFSDSAYLVNCINQRWYIKWRNNGWKNAKNQPVENQDLWRELFDLLEGLDVSFHKVKGHSGVELNEMADGLANQGMEEFPDGGSTRIVDGKTADKDTGDNPPKPVAPVSDFWSDDDSEAKDEKPAPTPRTARKEENADTVAYHYQIVEGGYLLRLPQHADVMASLKAFCTAKNIRSGSISAIGALNAVELGYYHVDKKEYARRRLSGNYELLAFNGNITRVDGEPFIHAHAMLGDADLQAVGGHFFNGVVAVTMEVFLHNFSTRISRRADDATGLTLLDIDDA